MAPVAIREDAELAVFDERFDAILNLLEILVTVAGPRREAVGKQSGLCRIGLERGDNVYPIERAKMVEMHGVILQRVGNEDQIADVLCIEGHLNAGSVFDGADRSDAMHRGADAAKALGKQPGFPRIASL